MSNKELIDNLLKAQDLFVVLENRNGERYVESYQLPVIMLNEDKFWAKFDNKHSALGHFDFERSHILSYAYNNYSDVVCTIGLNSFTQRFYSSHVYSSLEFICRGEYKKIWANKGSYDLSMMSEAVRTGLKLKLIIQCKNNQSYILPVHTLEVFKDKHYFNLETNFDGFPDILRDTDWIKALDNDFKNALKQFTPPSYPGTHYSHDQNFFMMSFITNGRNLMQRIYNDKGQFEDQEFDFNTIEIFAEIN